jgi:anti-sigma regulatory factor (Ser/Thr protein kinase)
VIGDVVGKGATAAAMMGLARYTIRTAAMSEGRPSAILETLNQAVLKQTDENRFCTACCVRLRRSGNDARVTIATGGHPLPLVLHEDGSIDVAGTPGTIIGVFDDPVLTDRAIDLGMGDSLVLYTDGVTDERRNSDAFGEVRLHEALSSRRCGRATDRRRRRRRRGRFPERSAERRHRDPHDQGGRMTNLELTLEPVPDSIPQARQTLDRLADAVEEPLLDNLRLLVSEVVTNSIRHGQGFDPIELRVSVRPLVVRVEVEDRGPGFEPRLTDDDGERNSGWGLLLVDRLAARWGVVANSTNTVWFELDRRSPPVADEPVSVFGRPRTRVVNRAEG